MTNMPEPTENQSPVPQKIKPVLEELPICPHCKERIEKVKWMDYEIIRVVMHENCMKTIGTINLTD